YAALRNSVPSFRRLGSREQRQMHDRLGKYGSVVAVLVGCGQPNPAPQGQRLRLDRQVLVGRLAAADDELSATIARAVALGWYGGGPSVIRQCHCVSQINLVTGGHALAVQVGSEMVYPLN